MVHLSSYLHAGLALNQLRVLVAHLRHVDDVHPVALNINGSSRHDVARPGLAERLPRDVALPPVPAQGVALVPRRDAVHVPVPLRVVAAPPLVRRVARGLPLVPDVAGKRTSMHRFPSVCSKRFGMHSVHPVA